MSSSPAIELASTIQSASINRAPSLRHDLNPSTAASRKEPVTIPDSERSSSSIPYSAIKPVPRRKTLPPLPDLRFEQSYLASLQGAESWARIAWITGRDQVLLPLLQGTLWTLALQGWRFWNRSAKFSGANVGSRIRRWWWDVNNWEIPPERNARTAAAMGVSESERYAGEVREYYTGPLANPSGD